MKPEKFRLKSSTKEGARESAREYFINGRNCCQAVFNGVLEAIYEPGGLTHDSKLGWKIGRGFGGGMKVGEVCGALTGAILAAGWYLDESKDIKNYVKDLITTFELEFNSLLCRSIKEDGKKCHEYVAFVASYLTELLERA